MSNIPASDLCILDGVEYCKVFFPIYNLHYASETTICVLDGYLAAGVVYNSVSSISERSVMHNPGLIYHLA